MAGRRQMRLGGERGALLGFSALAVVGICGCPSGPVPSRVFRTDTNLAELTIAAEELNAVEDNAVLTISGDVLIDGTLQSRDGRLTLRVEGNVTVNGELRAVGPAPNDDDLNDPLGQQPGGVFIIIGNGSLTFGENASVTSTGPVVITDDDSVLDDTPEELYDEVEDVSGEDIATLAPLSPDNDAFDTAKIIVRGKLPTLQQPVGAGPVTISGTWPGPGSPPVPGDQPVVILRFSGSRPMILDDWTVNGPAAPAGRSDNQGTDPGESATGSRGRNGVRLNIRNGGGPINIVNDVELNLADGGDGGGATAVCADATGGNGGLAGNFRMSAAGGIDIASGRLTINPGRGGDGGRATVQAADPGDADCPGDDGEGGTATGGTGAANEKRIFVRGAVSGLDNVTIGQLGAGNGGEAIAEGCPGDEGDECCSGGDAGSAIALGGPGGNASLDVGTSGIETNEVIGGDGGDAEATGGTAGLGGDCKFQDAGDGGSAGSAAATGGDGGNASNTGDGGSEGGDGGEAVATGGTGGAGGDSGFGDPGTGGAGGLATSQGGDGGTGETAGTDGDDEDNDGEAGADGEEMDAAIFCLTLADFIDLLNAVILPGQYEGPVTGADNRTQIGEIDIEFPLLAGAEYQSSDNPVPHVGISNGALVIDLTSLVLEQPAGVIGGIRITPLDSTGVGALTPVLVHALAANGNPLDTAVLTTLPDNSGNPANPESVDVLFELDAPIAAFEIDVPAGAFVTLIRVYLLDP